MQGLGGGLPAGDGLDGRTIHFGIQAGAVEQEGDIVFRHHTFIEDRIPDGKIFVGVAVEVFHTPFFEDAGFPQVFVLVVDVRAADVDPNFAGGVPAQHRAVLHEDNRKPFMGGDDCRGSTGDAAADDAQVDGGFDDRENIQGLIHYFLLV